jgi:hypothetical protein
MEGLEEIFESEVINWIVVDDDDDDDWKMVMRRFVSGDHEAIYEHKVMCCLMTCILLNICIYDNG